MTQMVSDVNRGSPIFSTLRRDFKSDRDPLDLKKKLLVLCGPPGSGKSTFLLSIPRCCILDSEGGATELATVAGIDPNDPRFPWRVSSYEDFEKMVEALEKDRCRTYDMVAIDTLDTLGGNAYSLIAEHVVREANAEYIGEIGVGTGWNRLSTLTVGGLLRIMRAGYGLILAVHVVRKMVNDGDGTRTMLTRDLTGRLDGVVCNRATIVMMCKKTPVSVPITKKVKLPNGKEIEKEVGTKIEHKHRIEFRSSDAFSGEWMKARILDVDGFEFGPEDGWARLEEEFNKAVQKKLKTKE